MIARAFKTGREFVLDAPTSVPALHGRDHEVLWSQGEPLLICSPQGVSKSTLMQQLMLHRIGVASGSSSSATPSSEPNVARFT